MTTGKLLSAAALILVSVSLGAYQAPAACPVAPGDWDYCALCGPCNPGEGDCDSDSECADGLNCEHDVGPTYGLAKGVDVCVGTPTAPTNNQPATPSTDIDPDTFGGGVDGSATPATPTTLPEDCSGLNFLLNPACQTSTSTNTSTTPTTSTSSGCAFPVGHPSYCFSCGPCDLGEGGCNRNYQCMDGLICDLATNTCIVPVQ